MATQQILTLLIHERDKLNRAIELLVGQKRRGRPPANPELALLRQAAFPNGHNGHAQNGGKKLGPHKPTEVAPMPGVDPAMVAQRRLAQSKRMKALWKKRKKLQAQQTMAAGA